VRFSFDGLILAACAGVIGICVSIERCGCTLRHPVVSIFVAEFGFLPYMEYSQVSPKLPLNLRYGLSRSCCSGMVRSGGREVGLWGSIGGLIDCIRD
jgi:hypothetical protein